MPFTGVFAFFGKAHKLLKISIILVPILGILREDVGEMVWDVYKKTEEKK